MQNWEKRKRPIRLERRFEFASYELTRDFLDRLGDLSESIKRYPDISFGKLYVNITLRPEAEEESAELTVEDYDFASKIEALFS